MPENPRSFILGLNVPPAVPPGSEAEGLIGFDPTASGPALLVSIVGAPVIVNVNLDLADDEVAIGGPDAGATRRLFLGVFDGAASNILAVTTVAGFPISTLLGDGTNDLTTLFDLDTGAGAEWNLGVNLRFASAGGSVEAGTAADPIRTDPTGTTSQPVNDGGGSLSVDDAGGSLTVDGTVAVGPTVTPGTGATNLGKAEDQAAASGDVGVQALTVRRDVDAPDAADGDYVPLHTGSDGRLKVDAAITSGGGSQQFARDSVAGAADLGTQALAVRTDTPASLVGATGDYTPTQTNEDGFLRTVELGGDSFNAGDVNVPSGPAVSVRAANVNRISLIVANFGPGPLQIALTAAGFNTTGIPVPRGERLVIRNYRGEVFGVSNAVGTRAKVMEQVE